MNSMTVTYVIALYIRLSIEDSKVESLSIENQKNALHKYVDTMEGVRNVEVLEFIDNGYSGTNFERPAIQELLELVRAGKINCIIVKDFSRFGRNSIEVGYFMERVFPLYESVFYPSMMILTATVTTVIQAESMWRLNTLSVNFTAVIFP